jgi:hypothetical protein
MHGDTSILYVSLIVINSKHQRVLAYIYIVAIWLVYLSIIYYKTMSKPKTCIISPRIYRGLMY